MSAPPPTGGAAGGAPPAAGDPQSTQDLTIFVQNLLGQMQTRFQNMSDGIIGKIDEMGARIDDLEKNVRGCRCC